MKVINLNNIIFYIWNKKILGVCGSKSGRDIDKIKELNLTLIDGNKISVPAIKELPLTLECKVIYKQTQVLSEIPEDIQKSCYPQDVPSTYPMANKDVHIAFYGQIVDAYILKWYSEIFQFFSEHCPNFSNCLL